jgi:transcriptional regulator with XRE-family HTH domain
MVGLSLAERRFNAGMTPEELSERTKVSSRTIRRLENGSQPNVATAKKLADYFEVQPSELFPRTDAEAAA